MINYQTRDLREEEEDFNTIYQEISSTSTATTSTTSMTGSSTWSRFKDPRIVQVSRTFGGKDRHSKVCTTRGVRDRRVRLSVPTAIQLYDLQDRLGLNQPSKVVDWLLNVAKHEIDGLPPLRFPGGRLGQDLHQNPNFLEFGGSQSSKDGLKIKGSGVSQEDPIKTKDVTGRHQEERRFDFGNQGAFVFSRPNNSLHSNTYNNQVFRWDPSGLTLSPPSDDLHHISLMPMAGSHQVMVYQSGLGTHESHFPSNSVFDPKRLSFKASTSTVVDGSHTAELVSQPQPQLGASRLIPEMMRPAPRPHHQVNRGLCTSGRILWERTSQG